MNRRKFLHQSTCMGGAAGAVGMIPAFGSILTSNGCSGNKQAKSRSLTPTLLMNETVSFSKPILSSSQLSFRIGMARTRMSSYPCNSMDLLVMDIERPENKSRKAHWSTGDLSGRLLEFLSCSEGVDGNNDPRLDELFERIYRQRQPSGMIGIYTIHPDNVPVENDPYRWPAASKLFPGLLRYYDLTGDKRALEAAEGLAEVLWSVRDVWAKAVRLMESYIGILQWVTEPFARLYAITKDQRWMDFCAMIRDNLPPLEGRQCHSHGYLSTMRGFQVMTLVTGDLSWNILPDKTQKYIIDNYIEMPDGNIPEMFPAHPRNEGCSIADWIMLNLNQGLINGDDFAYDRAERTMWNAMAFNQLVTGGFGHRRVAANGYGIDQFHESWWCCTENAGMGLSEYARHTVTYRNGVINVNFLTPGVFEVPLPGGKWAKVSIETIYPSKAEATIIADNVPEDINVKVRVPLWVKNPRTDQNRSGNKVEVSFRGDIGHRIERTNTGVFLTYGPLILVPTRTVRVGSYSAQEASATELEGYDPQSMPTGIPLIKLDAPPDADGFIKLPLCPPERPLPPWNYWFEGYGSPTWVEGAGVEAGLKFPDGQVMKTRFAPMCYSTSCLSLFETPVVFRDVEM